MEAVMERGIDLVRFIRGAAEVSVGEDEDDVVDAYGTMPALGVRVAIAAAAPPP